MRRTLLALLCALSFVPWAAAQEIKFGLGAGGSGTTTIASGTTPITGGADTQLCFNDGAFISCGDAGLVYAKATDILTMLGGATIGSVTTAGRATLNLRDTITGSSATSNFLNITGSFPATLSANANGVYVSIAADNDAFIETGVHSIITGTGPGSGAVAGVQGDAGAASSAYNFGVIGRVSGNGTTGVGVMGLNYTGTNKIGGYFALANQDPPATSAALVIDNAAVAANIFEARDNGTAVLTVADGGAVTTTGVWNWTTQSSYFSTGAGLFFGASPNDGVAGIVHKTNQTPDTVSLVTPGTSNSWQLTEFADFNAFDFNNGACGTSACTDPGLIIHSAVQDTTQYNHLSNWGQAGGALKTLTESAATSVVRIPIANLAGAFGKFCYTVKAADATDSQIRGSCIKYTVTAKAGTETCSLNTESATVSDASITETEDGSGSGAITTGTLTYAITCDTTPANAVDLQINAVSSLTQTTLNVQYNLNHVGPGQPARQ